MLVCDDSISPLNIVGYLMKFWHDTVRAHEFRFFQLVGISYDLNFVASLSQKHWGPYPS